MPLKPLYQRKQERLPKVRSMTIVAGIVCSDGILICADMEHVQGDTKFRKTKIFGNENNTLIVTGCDQAEYIKIGYDKLSDKIRYELPDHPAAARILVEEATSKFYKMAQLIVAVRCANKELALIKTAGSSDGALLEPRYSVLGTGYPVFEYWAQYFLFAASLNLEIASHIMMFMLREAKGVGRDCGGPTELWKMPHIQGMLQEGRHAYSERDVLAGFPQSTIQILLTAMDLNQSDDIQEKNLTKFSGQVTDLRQFIKQKARNGAALYTATTYGMTVPKIKEDFE